LELPFRICRLQNEEFTVLEHADWSKQELAQAVGRSKSWVKKWLKRIHATMGEQF